MFIFSWYLNKLNKVHNMHSVPLLYQITSNHYYELLAADVMKIIHAVKKWL